MQLIGILTQCTYSVIFHLLFWSEQDEIKEGDRNLDTGCWYRTYRKQPAACKCSYFVFCIRVQSLGKTVIALHEGQIRYPLELLPSLPLSNLCFLTRGLVDTAHILWSDFIGLLIFYLSIFQILRKYYQWNSVGLNRKDFFSKSVQLLREKYIYIYIKHFLSDWWGCLVALWVRKPHPSVHFPTFWLQYQKEERLVLIALCVPSYSWYIICWNQIIGPFLWDTSCRSTVHRS